MTRCDRSGQCPAASAYGDLRRCGLDAFMREAERVRTILDACHLPAVTPMPVVSPAEEVADHEFQVRRSKAQGFWL